MGTETGLKKSQCSKVMGVLADGPDPGEEGGQVCGPRCVHGEDACEAGDEGGQEVDVWQGGSCQGEASQDNCQGLAGRRAQEGNLSPAPSAGEPLPRGPATGR